MIFNQIVKKCGYMLVCCCNVLKPKICYFGLSHGLSTLALFLVHLRRLFHLLGSIAFLDFVGTGFQSSAPLHYVELLSHVFPSKSSPLPPCWCIFHTGICLPETVIKFLAVCPKQLILVKLVLSFPLSR